MDNLELTFLIIWFVLIIGTAALEVVTMDLTSVWFAIGAVFAFILALLGVNVIVQMLAFLAVSIALLFSIRPIAKNYFRTNIISTNSDRLVGKTATCVKEIIAGSRGEVKVDGKIWTAITHDDSNIALDDKVEILAIEGNKLIVIKT